MSRQPQNPVTDQPGRREPMTRDQNSSGGPDPAEDSTNPTSPSYCESFLNSFTRNNSPERGSGRPGGRQQSSGVPNDTVGSGATSGTIHRGFLPSDAGLNTVNRDRPDASSPPGRNVRNDSSIAASEESLGLPRQGSTAREQAAQMGLTVDTEFGRGRAQRPTSNMSSGPPDSPTSQYSCSPGGTPNRPQSGDQARESSLGPDQNPSAADPNRGSQTSGETVHFVFKP